MFPMMGMIPMATATCPNCGHSPYKEKDACEKCGYLKPNRTKLPDAYLVFCKTCGCYYTSESGACPLHGLGSHITKPNL